MDPVGQKAVIDMNTEKPDTSKKSEGLASRPSIEIARANSSVSRIQDSPMAANASGENMRRRLVKGALTAAPVVLTLRGQSALATTGCASPSAVLSGNQSPGRTAKPCGAGWSPGYWKVCQHLPLWDGCLTKPTYKTGYTCTSGNPDPNQMTSEGTLFKTIFANTGLLGDYSCWRILAYPAMVDKSLSGFNINEVQLARHLIATYLNRCKIGSSFPVTALQMQAMWDGRLTGYCPLGTGCTALQLWTAQTIVCYLRNYTMDVVANPDPIPWVC